MRTRVIVALVVLLPLLQVNRLHGSELSAKYYPLKPGMTWTYSAVSDKHETRKITVTNLPGREINGTKVTPRKWDTGGVGKYYLIGTDDRGTYRYGEQKSENSEPILTQPKVYYIHDPVSNGTTWDINTKMGDSDLAINLTVESVSEMVKVPAGTYKDCVKIKHAGGSQKDDASLSLEAYEWYAPDVGLVKSIVTITKSAKGQKKDSEHQTYQLESFQP